MADKRYALVELAARRRQVPDHVGIEYNREQVRTLLQARRLSALLCLAVLLLATLTSVSLGLPFAILVPVWLFLAFVVCVSGVGPAEDADVLRIPFLSIVPSRAPPIR